MRRGKQYINSKQIMIKTKRVEEGVSSLKTEIDNLNQGLIYSMKIDNI